MNGPDVDKVIPYIPYVDIADSSDMNGLFYIYQRMKHLNMLLAPALLSIAADLGKKIVVKNKIEYAKKPAASDVDSIIRHNKETSAYGEAHPFASFMRNNDSKIIAGTNGFLICGAIYTHHCVATNNRLENNRKQVLCCNTSCCFDFCSWHGFHHNDESTVPIASSNPCLGLVGNRSLLLLNLNHNLIATHGWECPWWIIKSIFRCAYD